MKRLLVLVLCALSFSCTDVFPPQESATAPSNVSQGVKVEFRVFGNLVQNVPVTIRHTNSLDGMTNVTGLVPYISSFTSNESSLFLYLEAGGQAFSQFATMQVQIFVDGKLFKEGAAQGFVLYTQASGTYRR